MAVDLSFGGSLSGAYGNILTVSLYGLGFLLVMGLILGFIWWRRNKNMFNISALIFIPRSSGMETYPAKGGYFKVKGTTVFKLKRKGASTVYLPPPPSNYIMSPMRTIMFVQKGIDDFEPIHPIGMRNIEVKTKSGKIKRVNIFRLRCINQDAMAWAIDFERDAEKRFTIGTIWTKYKELITIVSFGFIFIVAGIVMWKGLEEIALKLAEVAKSLAQITFNTPVVQ